MGLAVEKRGAPLGLLRRPITGKSRTPGGPSPFIYRTDSMSKWLLSLSIVGLAGAMGVTWVKPMVARTEEAARSQAATLSRVTRELSTLQQELASSREALAKVDVDRSQQSLLEQQLTDLSSKLSGTQAQLQQQTLELANVEQRQTTWMGKTLGERFADMNRNIESRWNDVSQTLNATARIAATNKDSFDHLRLSVDKAENNTRDINQMWRDLMGPTVQISDDSTVGSGVLLRSVELDPGNFRTHLLTAWHVVRDIIQDPADHSELVQVYVYDTEGNRRREWASLVGYDANLDSALLVMESNSPFENGAKLPGRQQLDGLAVFSTIYAVGCPLGNDPIPTFGEIADTHHEVEGNRYWMINAPTYIGNSGGGIFASSSHELLGIFSKIYTHGNLRPTVIPHMGLVTPLSSVYDWLEATGNGHVIPE